MKSILLFTLIALIEAQNASQSPSPTQNPSPTGTPTPTPIGSPMFAYVLTFPKSNPFAAMRADRLAYLIKAIACSANVPVELVYISHVRADYNYVAFKQETHTTTGLIQNCATLTITPSLRGLQFTVSTSSNALLEIYYLSPRRANPADLLFQPYASAILASESGSLSSGNLTESMQGQNQGQGQGNQSISGGGIAGIVLGVLATVSFSICLYLMCFRTKKQPIQIHVPRNSLHEFKRVKKVTLPTAISR